MYNKYLMIEFILGGLLLTIVWFSFSFYYKPKKQLQRYAEMLTELGYTVYKPTYRPFQISFMKDFETGIRDHGDALYIIKNEYSKVDVALEYVLNKIILIPNNPDLLRDVFAPDKVNVFKKHPPLVDGFKQLLGAGILFSEGSVWKNKRIVISNAFNFDLLKENIPKICQICDRKILALEQQHKVKEGQSQYYIMDLGNGIFNSVMMACFFGSDQVKEKINDQSFDTFIVKLMDDANEAGYSAIFALIGKNAFRFGGVTPKIRKLLAEIKIYKSIASNIIARRIQEVLKGPKTQKCSDIIANLVREQQKQKQKGVVQCQYTNDDILQEFSTFVVAGTDTTAHLFMMMVYQIVKNPEIQQRLRKNIDEVIKTDQDYTYENLKKLVFIDWIQFETLRCFGPGHKIFIRQAAEDSFIGKIPIPKGTLFDVVPISNHYSEKYFKDPQQFRPQRWESECNNLQPFTYANFSGGPRSCIGKQLALIESKIAVIKLFKRYDKIVIPSQKMVMVHHFLYEPMPFKTKLRMHDQSTNYNKYQSIRVCLALL